MRVASMTHCFRWVAHCNLNVLLPASITPNTATNPRISHLVHSNTPRTCWMGRADQESLRSLAIARQSSWISKRAILYSTLFSTVEANIVLIRLCQSSTRARHLHNWATRDQVYPFRSTALLPAGRRWRDSLEVCTSPILRTREQPSVCECRKMSTFVYG